MPPKSACYRILLSALKSMSCHIQCALDELDRSVNERCSIMFHSEFACERKILAFICLCPFVVAVAATEPIGKFVPSDMGCVDMYVVGETEIALSHEAVWAYKKAARGDAAAQYEFAKVLNSAAHSLGGSPRVACEAFAWAMRSAVQEDSGGENYVGMAYKEGDGIGKDRREAERWLSKAVEHGSAKAMCNLAILHIENDDAGRAVKLARNSALSGYPDGQVLWGRMNLLGIGVSVDEKKAFGWFLKASKQNDIRAMALLATCYQNGKGTEENLTKAINLYEKVANGKANPLLSVLAKGALAEIYFDDKNAHDDALAVKWANEALCDSGMEALAPAGKQSATASMQYIIGLSYYKGRGVARNDEEAKKWLERAGAGGNIRAKQALEEMMEEARLLKERALAAKKAKEDAERKRAEENRRRQAEAERRERRWQSELAMQEREERAARILENAKKEYYEEKAREKWIELRYPEAIDTYRRFRDEWNAERMRYYQQGYW